MTAEPARQPNPRLHTGGKLSFRRRVRGQPPADSPLVVFGGDDPPPLGSLVPAAAARVEVEVGPGKGAFLRAAAADRPDTFFLGIEAAPAYALLAAQRLEQSGRSNGLLLVDHAGLYLRDRVPAGSVHRLHVYFPDPWPKRRHRKRRFFSAEMPDVLARILEPDGLCLVATDNAAYAGQICRVMGACPRFFRDGDAERSLLPGQGFSPTEFERKYAREGRLIRRYAFRRRRD